MELQTGLPFTPAQAEQVLAAWLESDVQCTAIQPLTGGMINTVLRLEFNRAPFSAVIKLNKYGQAFDREARALRHLRTHTRFPCPRVYLESSSAECIPYTFILLEALPGGNMWDLTREARLTPAEQTRIDQELAAALLELHSHTRDTYGGVDESPGHERWTDVFLPRVLEVRSQLEIETRLSAAALRDVDRAIGMIKDALSDQGRPTLIHGDIWAANIIVEQTAHGWRLSGLVDPGAEYADVEMELAYLQTFDNPATAFFAAYTAHRPLRPGYEMRRRFYWLHTYLIHVWLFGDPHYCDATARVAAEIARET